MLTIDDAIDIFLPSFACTRGITHPVEVIQRDGLRILRDLPRRGVLRREEIFTSPLLRPKEALAALESYNEAAERHYMLCAFVPTDPAVANETKEFYKRNGFRFLATEPLMVADLRTILIPESPHEVRRVTTSEELDRVTGIARGRWLLPEHLTSGDAPIRLYTIEKDGKVVAFGRDITPPGRRSSYVAGLSTEEAFRRQGMASAILRRIFSDDRKAGLEYSVLLASRLGSLLYGTVGYVQIGSLLMFVKRR